MLAAKHKACVNTWTCIFIFIIFSWEKKKFYLVEIFNKIQNFMHPPVQAK